MVLTVSGMTFTGSKVALSESGITLTVSSAGAFSGTFTEVTGVSGVVEVAGFTDSVTFTEGVAFAGVAGFEGVAAFAGVAGAAAFTDVAGFTAEVDVTDFTGVSSFCTGAAFRHLGFFNCWCFDRCHNLFRF